jgi:NADH:ubiquinone oxidoreductase subunit 5 (subunit L)/multisubunit Na+/H+ antiporter MnhA subunit
MQRTSVIQPTTTVDTLVQEEEKANDAAIWVVFRKMLFFTIMLTIAPLSSFFLSKDYLFEGVFHMTSSNSYIYSVVVAVIVVHVILFAFLYVAFRDDRTGKKTPAEILKATTGKKD